MAQLTPRAVHPGVGKAPLSPTRQGPPLDRNGSKELLQLGREGARLLTAPAEHPVPERRAVGEVIRDIALRGLNTAGAELHSDREARATMPLAPGLAGLTLGVGAEERVRLGARETSHREGARPIPAVQSGELGTAAGGEEQRCDDDPDPVRHDPSEDSSNPQIRGQAGPSFSRGPSPARLAHSPPPKRSPSARCTTFWIDDVATSLQAKGSSR